MSLSLEVIDALVEAGCNARQLAAAIRADRARSMRLRAERLARKLTGEATAPQMNKPDSVAVVESGASDPVQSAGGTKKAVARTALLLATELKGAERVVGAMLVECFNLGNERCDPGVGYIASKTGLSERSVRRAVEGLERRGLFARIVHGGRRSANAYRPDWAALARLAAQSGNMNKPDSADALRTLESGRADTVVRQNMFKKHLTSVVGERARARANDRRQMEMLMVIPNKGDVEWGRAGRRLWLDIERHFPNIAARTEAIDRVERLQLMDRATAFEMRQQGGGIGLILRELVRDNASPPQQRLADGG